MLGAWSIDLSLLASFFEGSWGQVVPPIDPGNQAWLLYQAGMSLRAVGRLRDALEPMRSGADYPVAHEDWHNAARGYSNISELLLAMGQIREAIAAARLCVDFADRSGNHFQRLSKRSTLAGVLLRSGDYAEAQHLFAEAEQIQCERQQQYPILYSVQGFEYCDLLLEQGKSSDVVRRATQTLAWAEGQHYPLDIGLDHLSLGRAYPSGSSESIHHLDQAVYFLRQGGMLDQLPFGLLARGTPRDLEEVFRIATRSDMKLHLTDYHLASTRLALANHDFAKARAHFQQAEILIRETGYHRRDKQLEELRRQLAN